MWAPTINAVAGIFIMASPGIFHYQGIAADNEHIVGPVIATFAMISISQSMRELRKVNIILGIWLLIAPFVLDYRETTPYWVEIVSAVVIISLSFVKGKITHEFGGGWRSLWQDDPQHMKDASH